MKTLLPALLLIISLPSLAAPLPNPPLAEQKPERLETHGDVRVDPYFWLRQRDNPAVIAYLQAENAYTEASLAPQAAFRKLLVDEMRGRIQETDQGTPVRRGGWDYYTRTEEGKQYMVHCRRRAGVPNAAEEVLVDENALAAGHDSFSLEGPVMSDDGNLMAYGVNTTGDRVYQIRFKDLRTGQLLADTLEGSAGEVTWASDNRTVFYVRTTQPDLRSRWVYRYRLGSGHEELVYDETDERFDVGVSGSRTRKYILIVTRSSNTSEVRYLDAARPEAAPRLFAPRAEGEKYTATDGGDRWIILTNHDGATNYRVMEAPKSDTSRARWTDVIAPRTDVYIEGVDTFRDFIALQEKQEGISSLRVLDRTGLRAPVTLPMPEALHTVSVTENPDYAGRRLRYVYGSMTTPSSTYEYDGVSGSTTLLRRSPVNGGYDPARYETRRLWVTAKDGARIPVSIVHKKSIVLGPTTPLLIYGYGSYGAVVSASFSSPRLSLLDRGFVYAIAHVRGGSDMGQPWYLHGHLLEKKNTFDDFIAVTEAFHAQGISSPRHTYAEGGSAGGLLMGAVMNARPELYHAMIAEVPFVDVVSTMLDTSLPLTTGEFLEWGDPRDPKYYDYIKSYSPYDNVRAQDYPNLLVTAGFNDTNVPYWEPAKLVAKLRRTKTDQNVLLLKTEMNAGHQGKSGRFSDLEEEALYYAFFLGFEGATR